MPFVISNVNTISQYGTLKKVFEMTKSKMETDSLKYATMWKFLSVEITDLRSQNQWHDNYD